MTFPPTFRGDADRTLRRIRAEAIVADLAPDRPVDEMLEMGDALQAAPVLIATIDMGYAGSLATLREFCARYGRNALVGASRVRTLGEAGAAWRAGAAFLLSEGYRGEILFGCAEQEILCIPVMASREEACALSHAHLPMVAARAFAAGSAEQGTGLPVLAYGVQTASEARASAAAGACAISIGPALRDEDGSWTQARLIRSARAMRAAWNGAQSALLEQGEQARSENGSGDADTA